MRKIILTGLFFLSLAPLYSQNTVFIGFKYSNLEVQSKETSDGKREKSVTDYGYHAVSQLMLDQFEIELRDVNGFSVVRDSKSKADYVILITHVFVGNNSLYHTQVDIYEDDILIASDSFRSLGNTVEENIRLEDISAFVTRFIRNREALRFQVKA